MAGTVCRLAMSYAPNRVPGLDPFARRFVGFSKSRNNWSRDFSHEAPVLLDRLELEFADDVLHRDVFQTALAKRCLHKSRCGTSKHSRRSRRWRGYLNVLTDRAHNRGGPRIPLGRIPHGGAHATSRFRHAHELLHTQVNIREEHEAEPAQHGIERAVGEWKGTGIALFGLKVF